MGVWCKLQHRMVSVWLPVASLFLVSLSQAAPTGPIQDALDVRQAKQEFMLYFDQVLNGYLSEISPKQVQDTREVREAKEEFFRVFNKALDGMIEAVFNSDTQEVREKKEAFVRTFDAAVDDLFNTVEGFYTPEQVEARNNFQQAYQDASDGKIGAQYIAYTPEVQAARERFFEFFQFALDGMLYKLAPKPGYNQIPEQIADFYIKDDPEAAAEELERTLNDIAEVIDEANEDSEDVDNNEAADDDALEYDLYDDEDFDENFE